MPGPALPLLARAGQIAWRAYSAYEAAQTAAEAAKLAAELNTRKREFTKIFKTTIEQLKDEIEINTKTMEKIGSAGRSTLHRRGSEGTTYKEYIDRKIPFRPAISLICNAASNSPIKVPRRLRKKIPGDVIETTIEVSLKQTTASLMFEVIDEALEWRSPLKAEPNYDKTTKVPYLGTPQTRPHRISDIFPFWPRPKNSLAPDLVIVEYRQKSFETNNVFAAIEIKFPRDWVKIRQLEEYAYLMTPAAGPNPQKAGKEKVALLRVPEDCTSSAKEVEKGNKPRQHNKGKTK
ncbi:VRR-NUC domain-containing protein [Pseudomonas sp. S60]|uniref:VRR-NUC domain-containing protein n=1 Tax=Pseudomonas sp. S60 TaxID=211124 RepID=UPI001911D224|nr:VRR-NUC domain-containing protein [Pseudomonas sp. S60]MBK5012988.1 VRR-NUC domain-containing protein [Pseudomonas sp. S60]